MRRVTFINMGCMITLMIVLFIMTGNASPAFAGELEPSISGGGHTEEVEGILQYTIELLAPTGFDANGQPTGWRVEKTYGSTSGLWPQFSQSESANVYVHGPAILDHIDQVGVTFNGHDKFWSESTPTKHRSDRKPPSPKGYKVHFEPGMLPVGTLATSGLLGHNDNYLVISALGIPLAKIGKKGKLTSSFQMTVTEPVPNFHRMPREWRERFRQNFHSTNPVDDWSPEDRAAFEQMQASLPPAPMPTPTPAASPAPQASPSPETSPSPAATPTPTPTPTATPTTTPTPQPTPTPQQKEDETLDEDGPQATGSAQVKVAGTTGAHQTVTVGSPGIVPGYTAFPTPRPTTAATIPVYSVPPPAYMPPPVAQETVTTTAPLGINPTVWARAQAALQLFPLQAGRGKIVIVVSKPSGAAAMSYNKSAAVVQIWQNGVWFNAYPLASTQTPGVLTFNADPGTVFTVRVRGDRTTHRSDTVTAGVPSYLFVTIPEGR